MDMPVPKTEMGRLQARLLNRGVRLTEQRRAVLQVIETTDRRLDASRILRKARNGDSERALPHAEESVETGLSVSHCGRQAGSRRILLQVLNQRIVEWCVCCPPAPRGTALLTSWSHPRKP
jgi:hypothetical protein